MAVIEDSKKTCGTTSKCKDMSVHVCTYKNVLWNICF